MNCQMIRVISSPSSSTTGFFTLILATPVLHTPRGSLRPLAPVLGPRVRCGKVVARRSGTIPCPATPALNDERRPLAGPALAKFGKAADAYSAGWASAGAASAAGAAGSTEM